MSVLIFDIDGTLVDSTEFDADLYVAAVKEVVGDVFIHDDWSKYDQATDPGILTQILPENGIQNGIEIIMNVRQCFGDYIKDYLDRNPCLPILGALEEFDKLRKDRRCLLGIATGGWGHTALMKLGSAGFDVEEIPLFSGDHHYERMEIMKSCKDFISPHENSVVYIGDGIWDLQAAEKLNWGFVGIGESLRGKASVWTPNFISELWKSAPERALRLRMLRGLK